MFIDPQRVGTRLHTRLSQAALLSAGAYYRRRLQPALEFYRRGKYWRVQKELARGSGTPLDLMFGLSAVPEVLGSKIDFSMGCTTLAIAAEAAAAGSPLIAYNHDFPARFGKFLYLRRSQASDALRHIELVYPLGAGSVAGVNEAGLAVALNAAFATDFHRKPGIQPTFLVRDCLEHCRSVAEAVEVWCNTPVSNGSMVTLTDATGDRAVVELSCTQTRVRRDEGPVMATFNKYKHPDMAAYEVPLHAIAKGLIKGLWLHETNIARQNRIDELLAERPAKLGDDDILNIMGDHAGGVGSNNTLCRHYDMGATLATAILDPHKRTIKVAFGHACRGTYQEHGLDPVPAQRSVA